MGFWRDRISRCRLFRQNSHDTSEPAHIDSAAYLVWDDCNLRCTSQRPVSERPNNTLGDFIADYFASHAGTVKPTTVTTWRQCERLLLEYFDADESLRSITEGRAVEWRNYLVTRDHTRIKRARKLSESTIRRRCGCAIQFFEHAVRLGLIDRNPFKSKRIPTTLPKPKQKAVITTQVAIKIMDQLPTWEMRLIFALARWGGVRVPSEPAAITWDHVDMGDMRLTVPSPKTEHHEGREQRIIPIFPELVQPLRDAWEAADEKQPLILPRLQTVSSAALRKPMLAAIRAAGEKPWPKLWTALRATRDTELRETFAAHVVEAWLGHDDETAQRNYTQVTDAHFERAIGVQKSGAESGAQAVQNAVQQPAAADRTSLQLSKQQVGSSEDRAKKTEPGVNRALPSVGGTGLEPATSTMSTWRSSQLS